MNINPLEHSHNIEPVLRERGMVKIEDKTPVLPESIQISSSARDNIQKLKQIAEVSPQRLAKMKEARELLESGAIFDRKILEAAAQKILYTDPLSLEDS